MVFNQVRFKKLAARVSLPPRKIVLVKSTLTPAHGVITARGVLNTASGKYHLDFLGKNLRAGDYARKQLQGLMRVHGAMDGHIPEKLPGIRGLFGNLSVKISPVKFDRLEPVKNILAVIDPAYFGKNRLQGMRFQFLGGNFKIRNGKFRTTNLALKGEPLNIYLEGLYDAHTQQLDLRGKALPKTGTGRALQTSPQAARMVRKSRKRLVETHFTLEGPVSRPQMTLLGIRSKAPRKAKPSRPRR
ncbi:MAG: AsmA-like C-terminal region-containing protein [Nitrospinaceae bacterium]|nr:AsmA-like C-terminal region-containing protein [Nitrospinaceae bacterium]NIS84122.1 AsmA-like C-terminal region-containing protein [Nitrospinaceae bacterium]